MRSQDFFSILGFRELCTCLVIITAPAACSGRGIIDWMSVLASEPEGELRAWEAGTVFGNSLLGFGAPAAVVDLDGAGRVRSGCSLFSWRWLVASMVRLPAGILLLFFQPRRRFAEPLDWCLLEPGRGRFSLVAVAAKNICREAGVASFVWQSVRFMKAELNLSLSSGLLLPGFADEDSRPGCGDVVCCFWELRVLGPLYLKFLACCWLFLCCMVKRCCWLPFPGLFSCFLNARSSNRLCLGFVPENRRCLRATGPDRCA